MSNMEPRFYNVPPDREIRSSRVFSYPRELLFRAWTDPDLLAAWRGPAGFTNTFYEFDRQPGGKWLFTMHGPDGKTYEQDKTFEEVIPGRKVSFRHHAPVHGFRMEQTYSDEPGGASRLDWRMRFDAPGELEKIRDFIDKANEENFDRLQSHLNSHAAS